MMKKGFVAIIVVVVVGVAGLCFLLGATIFGGGKTAMAETAAVEAAEIDNAAEAVDAGDAVAAEGVDAALEGRKVFLYTSYQGYALTEADVNRLVTQAKQEGCEGSTFVQWVEGDRYSEVLDPESGVVFANALNGYVDLSPVAKIYILDGIRWSEMANDVLSEDDFVYDASVETAYGTLEIYKRR